MVHPLVDGGERGWCSTISRSASMGVSRIFRTFNLAERHPALAHAVMAPLICWSLEQLDVEISLRRPRRAGDVAQPRGGEVERRLTVRKRAHDAGAPPDLAQDALERVVGAIPIV